MTEPAFTADLQLTNEELASRVVAERLARARALCGHDAAPALVAAVLAELGAETRMNYANARAAAF